MSMILRTKTGARPQENATGLPICQTARLRPSQSLLCLLFVHTGFFGRIGLTALTTALTALLLVLVLLSGTALALALAALSRLALATLALLPALLSLLAALSLLAGTIHFISHRKSPVSCIVGSPH
jgi:hypothetical protein